MLSKRINVNNIKNNMVLAKDIINGNGNVIALKDTILSEYYINKLKANSIEYVIVWCNSDYDEDTIELALEEYNKPVVLRKEFKKFKAIYEKNIELIKEDFNCIYVGKNSNSENLFKIINSMLDELGSKSDVVNYLYHLEEKSDYIYRHSINVSVLCYLFAVWAGMDKYETKILTISGILHDIGKTILPSNILDKNDSLSINEFNEVKKHPLYGYMLLFEQDIPDEIKLAVLMHHEKIDGTGYPFGVTGSKIDRFAKIVSICDIYDAMTTERAYHRKKCPFSVIKMFEQNHYGMLDVKNVPVFLRNIAYSYLGSRVRLSDTRIGEIVFINQTALSRPIVKIGNDFINLFQNLKLSIDDVL